MGGKDLWNERAEAVADRTDGPLRPTRAVAVALHYDSDVADAPRVVASGRGTLAEQILELAFASGVKVRSDPDLAEVLAAIELETVIPVEAFAAVAEILAYIYRANDGLAPAGAAAP